MVNEEWVEADGSSFVDEVLEQYTMDLKNLDASALSAELAALISVQPKFDRYLKCVVRELESRLMYVDEG